MGNQTLVPSQIQSVESYFLDLKSYIQFRSSLGSTTFMKTAKVNLIESLIDDYLIETRNLNDIQQISSSHSTQQYTNQSLTSNSTMNINSNLNPTLMGNQNQSTSVVSSLSTTTPSVQKLNQHQMIKQRMQNLRESQQQVVVKIFPKYDLSIRLDLYSKRVREIKNIIYSRYGMCTNCLPFSDLVITDRAAFLFRQFIRYNLYDRISTRPFLTLIEKKWITFQLLCAVNEIHSLQIVHGDIKAENVLVNSFLWVSLADFASYKPVYLSKNHPSADFNYYFDISRRRTCYLAPERLDSSNLIVNQSSTTNQTSFTNDHESNMYELPPDPNDFKTSMDIFSLGCVIAELFMERPLFDFAHLLAYREKKYDPSSELNTEIGDKHVLEMILSMLSLSVNERKTANEYLQEQNDKAFPSYFVFLKNYISRFIHVNLTSDEIVIRLKNDLPLLLKNFKLNLNDDQSTSLDNQEKNNANDAFLILLSLLLSCIRKLKFTENKLIAIELMSTFSKFLDDSIILDRVLPYYLALIEDQTQQQTQAPIVKSHVIYALNDCLSSIYNIDVQNLNIFPEIIFDCLETLSKDESFLVRSTVAKTISSFALTSLRYLDTVFLTRRSFNSKQSSKNDINESEKKINQKARLKQNEFDRDKEKHATYDKEYESYQNRLTEIIMYLITDINQPTNSTSSSSNAVKETLIRSDISKLCSFFSRQKTSEFLLPHMITILNEKTDWSVRAAFFDALCPVLTCIGWESVEIVKSLLEQGLRDSEEFVIYRTLITLGKMVEVGLLDRQQICYFLSNHIAPLLCHPSLWIRHGAVNFVTIVCRQTNFVASKETINNSSCLNTADILCSVAPLLTKFLERKDLINYDKEEILFNCLKKPIKRVVYDCISQDGISDQLFIYLNQRSEIRCLTNSNYLPGYVDCSDPNVQRFFEKLCKLGFIEEDEDKLLHLKEFMDKTRISRLSSSLHNADMSMSNNSTTSVLNASNVNLKENFSLGKDGYITIMKEKFQRCNFEYLNMRKDNYLIDFKSEATSNVETTTANSSSGISIKREKPLQTKLDEIHNESTYNPEWKLMFGKGSNQAAPLSPTTPTISNEASTESYGTLKKRNSAAYLQQQQNQILHQRQQQQQRSNTNLNRKYDCSIEVDKYLDRCKLIYEEHKNKQTRVNKYKETINSSISSNTISLFSSIGKWKPKGFLIAHSNEHTKEINKLSRNVDSTYFSTCSTAESSVKIWTTDNLLDGKSGFFKSVFTYDRQNNNNQNQENTLTRPCCTTFYNKNSLAILCEDFRFYVIDFNSSRTRYRLYANETLFRSNTCKTQLFNSSIPRNLNNNSTYEKITFYYLNKSIRNTANSVSQSNVSGKCSSKQCYCPSNYPIEMIRIDDSCQSWSMSATNSNDYFNGNRGSAVKGLFCYSTSTGDFSCIDMRTRSKAFDVKRDLRKGYITTMVTDPWYSWIGFGTSSGDIEIYDFRYMIPVKKFEHHYKSAVVRLCNHPISNSRIVASYQGNNEIAVWNMDENKPRNFSNKPVYDPEFVFWGEQSVPPLCQKKLSSSYIKYISGMIGCSANEPNGTNGLICVSTDMKMRYIDLNEPSTDSYIVSAAFNFQQNSKVNSDGNAVNKTSEFANSLMSQNVIYENRQIEGTKVLLELDKQYNSSGQQFSLNNSNLASTTFSYNSPALVHQSYFTHHQDAITDLVVCYHPQNNKNHPLLITSARDGALKIWR